VTKEQKPTAFDSSLCREVVDAVEAAVLVLDAARLDVRLANHGARELLGLTLGPLPPSLGATIGAWLACEPPRLRFASTIGVHTPDGRRFHVRAKRLGDTGEMLMLMLTLHVVRERDLDETLRPRFALSRREVQVVLAVKAGVSNSEIAEQLGLTEGTVKNYLSRVFTAVGVHGRARLLAYLQLLGLHA
jgi:DNA-binding CsgD family transcriptional regulator